VLHKDLKPANVLLVPGANGGWQIKIADFGSASPFDPSRLHALGITNLGFTQTAALESESSSGHPAGILTGTLLYIAPEVLAGQSPSAAADVHALGVLLYQLVGDFRKPLAPGWESEIENPLLREDIADAACGDPAKRLSSAAELVDRLLTFEQCRTKRDEPGSGKFARTNCRAQARLGALRRARTAGQLRATHALRRPDTIRQIHSDANLTALHAFCLALLILRIWHEACTERS
jgi:serine/threonine protein kinase